MVYLIEMGVSVEAVRVAIGKVAKASVLTKAAAADEALNITVNLLDSMVKNIEELAREIERMKINGVQ